MKDTVYVVRLGGKLYMQTEFYSVYPATTKDLFQARFFRDYEKASKLAKKAKGEVIEIQMESNEI